jgi:hypothetical protein
LMLWGINCGEGEGIYIILERNLVRGLVVEYKLFLYKNTVPHKALNLRDIGKLKHIINFYTYVRISDVIGLMLVLVNVG